MAIISSLVLFHAIAKAEGNGHICMGDVTEVNDNIECVRGRSQRDMVPYLSYLPPRICWS